MTIGAALRQGGEMLGDAFTAEVLLRHALHCQRAWLFAHLDDELPQRAWIHYGRFLNERLQGKPTQYITGIQEFYGRTFRVNPQVLIPRPETEHAVEAALTFLRSRPAAAVLDVGTGSGGIAITLKLECPHSQVFASDISPDALAMARRNARSLNADVHFVAADLLAPIRSATIDLLISNPPYVADKDLPGLQREVRDWEPHSALFAGPSGIEIYAALLAQARRLLRPDGIVIFELGYTSLEPVRNLFGSSWKEIGLINDLAGWPRVLILSASRRPGALHTEL